MTIKLSWVRGREDPSEMTREKEFFIRSTLTKEGTIVLLGTDRQ